MITKDKMFRNAQHLEIMIPLKYSGLWMMFTWNCQTKKGEQFILREVDFTKDQWKLMQTFNNEIIQFGKKLGAIDKKGKW